MFSTVGKSIINNGYMIGDLKKLRRQAMASIKKGGLVFVRQASSSSISSRGPGVNYCVNLVKTKSYEQYLASLLLPVKIRRVGFAIRAFNVEISSVRDNVTAKHAGMGRMVFWREVINNIYDPRKSVPNHPVAVELNAVISHFNLSRQPFDNMIDSRELFIQDDTRPPFFSVDELETYSEKAFSSAYYLLLEALSQGEVKGHARHAANQIGKAEGITTLLRGIPHNAARLRKVYIPVSLLSDHKVSSENIIRHNFEEESSMRRLVESLAALAEDHLTNARFRAKYLDKEEKISLISAVLVDRFLTRLSRAKCDVYHPQLNTRDSWLPAILYWSKLRSTF